MSNDYRVVVTVAQEHAHAASSIGRAMDVDVGGADSFIAEGSMLVARVWASEAFASMFQYLIANPNGLYMAVASDYETRWPDLQPPTLQEIVQFCEAAELKVEQES